MGCCDSCLATRDYKGSSQTSKLLTGQQRKYVEDNGTEVPASARQHRPPVTTETSHDDNDDGLTVPKMKNIAIQSINKTFQDQEKLYNDVYQDYQEMKKNLHNFKSHFDKETSGIPELTKCIRILVERCGKAGLNVDRRRHCVQIQISEKELMKGALSDPVELITIIKLFNMMNKHLEKVLDHCQSLQKSIDVLIQDEKALKLQITKSSLPATAGTESIHNCIDNVKILQRMRNSIHTMRTKSEGKLKDVIESSKGFFRE